MTNKGTENKLAAAQQNYTGSDKGRQRRILIMCPTNLSPNVKDLITRLVSYP